MKFERYTEKERRRERKGERERDNEKLDICSIKECSR